MYKILMIVTLLTHLLFAQSIDQQISAIKSAPAAQRVALMNAFKLRLANMNREERLNAIHALRTNISSKHTTTMPQSSMHNEQVSHMQMQNSEEMFNHQNMNQNQAGRQVTHQYSKGTWNSQNHNGDYSDNREWRK